MTDAITQNTPPINEESTPVTAKDEIDQVIDQVVQSNIFNGSWNEVRLRLVAKIDQNIQLLVEEFQTEITEEIREYQTRIVKALEAFQKDPPFTVQRLCELIVYPKEHHRSLPKYMRALEKVVTVTSTYSDFSIVANGDTSEVKRTSGDTNTIKTDEEPVSMESEATAPSDTVAESKANDAEVNENGNTSQESTVEPPTSPIKQADPMDAASPNTTLDTNQPNVSMESEKASMAVPADDIELMKRGNVSSATAGPITSNPLSREVITNDGDYTEPMESEATMDTDSKVEPTEQQEEMDTTT